MYRERVSANIWSKNFKLAPSGFLLIKGVHYIASNMLVHVGYLYYHLHSIVTPRREMKVVSSFPTRVIIGQLYVLHFKLLIRGRERLQPFLQLYPANRYK